MKARRPLGPSMRRTATPAPPPPRLRDARPRDAIGYGVVLALLGFLFAWNVKASLDRRRLQRAMAARRR